MVKLVSGVRIDDSGRITHLRWQDAAGARQRPIGEASIVEISTAIDHIMGHDEPLIPWAATGTRGAVDKPVCVRVQRGGQEILVDADDPTPGLRLEDLPRI